MASGEKWTEASIGDQSGRVAIVTGANSGIGFHAARALAEHGATVVLACRNPQRAGEAQARIKALDPAGSAEVLIVDLGDLDSVAAAADEVGERFGRVDLLVNNAGVILVAKGQTAQGFESHLGVNHLGHFALTGRLLPLLLATPGSRVVTVASSGHKAGRLDFDDLPLDRRYSPMRAYGRSKLANLLFTSELQRRLERAGAGTIALAAHPGGAKTDGKVQDQPSGLSRLLNKGRVVVELFLQSPEMGALPTLRAATDPAATGDQYYGPDGFMETRGHPVPVGRNERAQDAGAAARLWDVSVEATGVDYAELQPQ